MFRKVLKGIKMVLRYLGFYPEQLVENIVGLPWYWKSYQTFRKLNNASATNISFGLKMPIFRDRFEGSGNLSGHYFHQDLLVAQRIFENKPVKHVDIGSRTDGFVTHVASYREIEVFDIRPSDVQIRNIKFVQADFTNIDQSLENYADSVSCLHVIEHFGLGRYSDPLDPEGHLKGLQNIYKVIKPGGKFYFSTPIGKERINFNAHRVFNLQTLKNLFEDQYHFDDFWYVDDAGQLHQDAQLEDGLTNNFGCYFGCGIFEMTKK